MKKKWADNILVKDWGLNLKARVSFRKEFDGREPTGPELFIQRDKLKALDAERVELKKQEQKKLKLEKLQQPNKKTKRKRREEVEVEDNPPYDVTAGDIIDAFLTGKEASLSLLIYLLIIRYRSNVIDDVCVDVKM